MFWQQSLTAKQLLHGAKRRGTANTHPESAFGWVLIGWALGRSEACEPPDELQESLGPSGPEIPKKSEKSLLGFGFGVPKSLEKVSKKSEKSGKSLENVCSGLFRDLSQTFGDPGPGDFFQTFWGFRARRARETPVARRGGSQSEASEAIQGIFRG